MGNLLIKYGIVIFISLWDISLYLILTCSILLTIPPFIGDAG